MVQFKHLIIISSRPNTNNPRFFLPKLQNADFSVGSTSPKIKIS